MLLELLWLLLPVAAASGWWAARRSARNNAGSNTLPQEYFKGINFLLNEQPDKAIEIFIRMVEVNSDTVEPHFALGSLFRRQGEVERAIRIHQNLMARPSLPREQRNQALFELGRDFQQAGLLDRAENLFRELIEREPRNVPARRLLIDIYEQEKEWEKAIAIALPLKADGRLPYDHVIANYYCELALQALETGDCSKTRKLIRRAYSHDRGCVRASLLAGETARRQGNYRAAIRSLKRVETQDPQYISEAIEPLLECHESMGRPEDVIDYLNEVLVRQEAFRPVLVSAGYLRRHESETAACELISRHLQAHPSLPGLAYLIESLATALQNDHRLEIARDSLKYLLDNIKLYNCVNCNFNGNTMRWQCPGCRSWNSVKPYQGRAG